ncbi:DDB1- and CUL4-associated factor 4-like protein 2 isoform X2 [Physella acuta]|uniref:DDB1- and CUL4-associated factor 4-like protein 2 isoform X2 n=1 Tax=Physella acuta TaxID=109671 RepID=UPI0027DBEC89|nr:DDB1- and CUL4-associated factor 4-like protein 2 isoform X2 [Physella acuta]
MNSKSNKYGKKKNVNHHSRERFQNERVSNRSHDRSGCGDTSSFSSHAPRQLDEASSHQTQACSSTRTHHSARHGSSRQNKPSVPSSAGHFLQASTQLDETESDLPGYYYDREKKSYFKILPNTMSSVGSFVTKETIKKQVAEKQRLSDIDSLGKLPKTQVAPLMPRPKTNRTKHLLDVLRNVQCGQFTCRNLSTYIIQRACCNIEPNSEWENHCPQQPSLRLEEIQKVEVSPERDKMVCVSTLKSSIAQCIQLMTVTQKTQLSRKDRKQTVIEMKPPDLPLGPIYKKVSSLCWAKLPNLPGKNTILYTTVCPIGYMPSLVYLGNLDAENNDSMTVFELNLGFKIVWSSAWDSHQSRFSVGSERKCHLIDVSTRRRWTYKTYNSDPLAQLFSPNNPNILYNGTRAGLILSHDVRCHGSGGPQAEMRQNEGIGCLRHQKDENYIMASDFSGTICTWDQRMHKVVMRYKGLINSHYQLPFYLDESETLLCSTGSDSYSKLWSVGSGELLRSIPPPYSTTPGHFPIAIYSQHWGNIAANSGLIIAMRNYFQVYS